MSVLGCTWQRTATTLLEAFSVQSSKSFQESAQVQNPPKPEGASATWSTNTNVVLRHFLESSLTRGNSFGAGAEVHCSVVGEELLVGTSRSNDWSHDDCIRNASHVRIIMNDGRTFFQKYEEAFRDRANSKRAVHSKTEICLLAPDGDHLGVIARRSEKSPEQESRNIQSSVEILKRAFSGDGASSRLAVFGLKGFFPYCMFQYDSLMVVSLYPAFSRIEQLPTLVLGPTGPSANIYNSLHQNGNEMFSHAYAGQTSWFDDLLML